MAKRPIFVPGIEGSLLVSKVDVEFTWYAGMAVSQKQKSIRSLHASAANRNLTNVLEISSKSENPLGVQLSAFNLRIMIPSGIRVPIECAFQSSKVFKNGGPFIELLNKSPREAKTDPRLNTSGDLVKFRLDGEEWPTRPLTVFYDWLYLTALSQSSTLAVQLLEFDGFTDIEFNPERSLNCQASSAALFVALSKRGELESAMSSKQAFMEQHSRGSSVTAPRAVQASLL